MRRAILWAGALLGSAWVALTIFVEREAGYRLESMGGSGKRRALVLYHPSRDARFSDDLSVAVADGLRSEGFSVDRATISADTPAHLEGYQFVVVVTNAYYQSPDWPTMRYLKRVRLDGIPAVGVVAGAGSTERAERVLGEALRGTGARVLGVRPFWLLRPNDETRMEAPNRQVGLEMARQFAGNTAQEIQ